MNSSRIFFLIIPFCLLTGCGVIGDKSFSLSSIYSATTVLALLLLISYLKLVKNRDRWFLLLFSSVTVVNTGYLLLSISKDIDAALLANRIAYLGSAMLPLSMLMIILRACKFDYHKWIPYLFFTISFLVFLIAASPGYLNIYYQEVSFEIINGVSMLKKVYGPWHSIYLFYLITYFSIMVITIIQATKNKRIASNTHAIILALAVLINIGVWLTEQLVPIDFEFLSISYIICELFLLALHLMMLDQEKLLPHTETTQKNTSCEKVTSASNCGTAFVSDDQRTFFADQLSTLTPTEKLVYDLYLDGKSTREILKELDIKENTLKYHNRNIYSKLGVSSRKQLLHIASLLKNEV